MRAILSVCISLIICIQSVFLVPMTVNAEETNTTNVGDTEPESGEAKNVEGSTADSIEISAPSAILMEASTGQIIYEKNAEEQRAPASVTKVMTLLLIFDAIEQGKISLNDTVTVSEYAASMGGSQVFFEPGEEQTVDTMIKCIAIASANDACVAMAEYIAGTEEEFVKQMNERAAALKMKDTTFKNCNGLDVDGHITTAKDIALMSRELIIKYPQIHDYSMIWMENITHVTKKGTTEFGLTNTNKLVKQYPYITGLKTGSTDKAKYCVSATAKKDEMELIAVVMAAPDYKIRFADATTMLNYGFAKCTKYIDNEQLKIKAVAIKKGVKDEVTIGVNGSFQYIDISGADTSSITKKVNLSKNLKAPIKKGEQVGTVNYKLNGSDIGEIAILTTESIQAMSYKHAVIHALESFVL